MSISSYKWLDNITCCDHCGCHLRNINISTAEFDDNGINCAYSNKICDNILCNTVYTLVQSMWFNIKLYTPQGKESTGGFI